VAEQLGVFWQFLAEGLVPESLSPRVARRFAVGSANINRECHTAYCKLMADSLVPPPEFHGPRAVVGRGQKCSCKRDLDP